MPLPTVSVVMPVHAKPQRLLLTLEGLKGQRANCRMEVILAADAPTAEVQEILRDQDSARVVEVGGVGRAGARNAGARAASGELLVFIDDDILAEGDFVERHLQAQSVQPGLVRGRLRELVGFLGEDDPAKPGGAIPAIDALALREGRWQPPEGLRRVANTLSQAIEHPDAAVWPWLAAGANLSIPRRCWERIGGFDVQYGTRWGMEDIDFAFRLWRAGVPIGFASAAQGFHLSHAESGRWDGHEHNLERFRRLAACPEADALDCLLSARGSVAAYRSRIDQIRLQGRPSFAPA